MSDRVIAMLVSLIVGTWAVMTVLSAFLPTAHPDAALVTGVAAFLGAAGAYLARQSTKGNGRH